MPTPPGIPRFRALADILRKRVLAHRVGYRQGDKFPTELDLIHESGYSRETVRAAVRVLRDEGLLEVILGVGTYVTDESQWRLKQ
jgi:GntR family transcriptional regulator